jgi:multiple sugar transport system ATP-binding protein
MMGSTVHLHLDAQGTGIVVVVATVDMPEGARAGFTAGSSVAVTFGGSEMHMFSKESEHNLI